MGYLSEDLFSCDWRFFWCVFFIASSVVERTVWNVVLASYSEDAAGGVRHVWNWRKHEWVAVSRAGGVPLGIWRLATGLFVQWLGSEVVLRVEE